MYKKPIFSEELIQLNKISHKGQHILSLSFPIILFKLTFKPI